jgi:hypothetical protein
MILTKQTHEGKIFACKITTAGKPDNNPGLAYVLFDGPKAVLLSHVMSEDGKVIRHVSHPWNVLDTDKLDITLLEETKPSMISFSDINDVVRADLEGHYGVVDEAGRFRFYGIMKPPKGTPVHRGYIETKTGRKELQSYPNCNLLRIIDCATGSWVDVEPSDIGEYFLHW